MNHKNWEINGCSLFFDAEDLESMERYENAFDSLNKEDKQRSKDGRASQRIRSYCEMYRNLYDRIFGKGTAEKIFQNVPMNVETYDNIYFSFLEFIRNQGIEAGQRKAERIDRMRKFTPNRQQKRYRQHHKK